MKFSRKMILVDYPEGGVQTLTAANLAAGKIFDLNVKTPPEVNFFERDNIQARQISDRLAELDELISKVLNAKNIDVYDKVKVYNDLLRRFMLTNAEAKQNRQAEKSSAIAEIVKTVKQQSQPAGANTSDWESSSEDVFLDSSAITPRRIPARATPVGLVEDGRDWSMVASRQKKQPIPRPSGRKSSSSKKKAAARRVSDTNQRQFDHVRRSIRAVNGAAAAPESTILSWAPLPNK